VRCVKRDTILAELAAHCARMTECEQSSWRACQVTVGCIDRADSVACQFGACIMEQLRRLHVLHHAVVQQVPELLVRDLDPPALVKAG
jgi:hypothetical protein